MALSKIAKADYDGKGVIGLPDTPQLSTQEMQRRFEEISTDVIIPAHNAMVDELEGVSGAGSIGTADGSNVQDTLEALNRKIQASSGDLSELVEALGKAETDIISLKTDNTINKADISTLKTDVTDLDAKKHTHTNKNVIDALSKDSDGDLNFEGQKIKGGGVTSYTDLDSKPQINNVTLTGNKTASQLGLALKTDVPKNLSELTNDTGFVEDSSYVHTDNNYTTADKTKLASLENYTLPDASTTVVGGVKYDNSTIKKNAQGQLYAAGGGSNVKWQQNTTSGTKIAEITIDGAKTEVYAPTGGGGSATDYSALTSKPQINGNTLEGNKTASQLGLASASDVYTKTEVDTSLSGKVDTTRKVNGHALTSDVTVSKSDVGLGNVGNFKAVSTSANQGLTTTEKSNARANIGAGTSNFSGSYNDLSNKPTIPSEVTEATVSGWGFTKNDGDMTKYEYASSILNGYVKNAEKATSATTATSANTALSLSDNAGHITSASDITAKLTEVDNKITKPSTALKDQVLTYNGTEWVAEDSKGGGGTAEDTTYDNSTSGLMATNVQSAIDEVTKEIANLNGLHTRFIQIVLPSISTVGWYNTNVKVDVPDNKKVFCSYNIYRGGDNILFHSGFIPAVRVYNGNIEFDIQSPADMSGKTVILKIDWFE